MLLIAQLLTAHYCMAQSNNDTISSSDTLMPIEQTPLNSKAIDAIVNYKAKDSMVFNLVEKKVYLYNKGEIKYESIELSSNKLDIDLTNNVVHAVGTLDSLGNMTGEPIFKDDKETFSARMIDYNIKTKKGKINKIITKQGEGYIHGNEVKKLEDNTMYIKNGKYTTCAHENPHFYIGSSKLKVVKNDKIVAGPAVLYVGDIPTPLGIPFGFFPITKGRSSGVIIPAYGNSISRGYFLREGGYYFGFSDFFDLRLTGDIYTLGSWGTKAVSSYKRRYKYNGKFSLKTATIKFGEEGLKNYKITKDFSINWRHNQDPKANPYRRFSAFVDFGTSTYDKYNAFAVNNKLKNTYQSSIKYMFSNPAKKHTLALSMGHSQNNITQIMNFTLPEVILNRKRFYLFENRTSLGRKKWYQKIGINYSIDSKNQTSTSTNLSLKHLDTLLNRNIGIRGAARIGSSLKLLKHFTFSWSGNVTNRTYFQKLNVEYTGGDILSDSSRVESMDNSVDQVYNFGANANLSFPIYGMVQFKKGKIEAIRHVMTTTAGFNYRPDFSQDKFGFYQTLTDDFGNTFTYSKYKNGIYGAPGAGKSGHVTISVKNNLEMKVKTMEDTVETTKKVKVFERLNFQTSYNAIADSLRWQPVFVNGSVKIGKKSDITFKSYFDPYITDSNNIRLNTSVWEDRNKLIRPTSGSVAMNLRLSSKGENKKKTSDNLTAEQEAFVNDNMDLYVDFSVPWSLRFGYQLAYAKKYINNIDSLKLRQTLRFSGDLKVTDNWKITFNSGYDFINKELTMTRINIFRNLHCWEMKFTWIPFGTMQSYTFDINVKASILQDLKLSRKKTFTDF